MRAAKMLAVLAIAALGIGSFSAVAAGKTYKGQVAKPGFCDPEIPSKPRWGGCGSHGQKNPTFDKSGLVIAHVMMFQVGGGPKFCYQSRSLRLQLLDRNGVVLTTLDRTRSPHNWSGISHLSGQLHTTLPAGTNYVRVKMKKRTVSLGGGNGHVMVPTKTKIRRSTGRGIPAGFQMRTDGKFVCQAGVTPNVAIPAA
jgi:hypothetical protein